MYIEHMDDISILEKYLKKLTFEQVILLVAMEPSREKKKAIVNWLKENYKNNESKNTKPTVH